MTTDNKFYNEINFKREFAFTEVSSLYLLSKLKNISSKVMSIARNKSSYESTPSMHSSYFVWQTSNNFFLVASRKFSLITFSKCSCLLGDKLKKYEIVSIT